MDALINKLKDLGFNTYEAKVYLALLKHHPATGYEISKESGVPQARAYDTLKALENDQVVVALGGKPTQYLPVSPDELLDRWEKSFKSSIGYLRDVLPTMSDETFEPVINLSGADSIVNHAVEMINGAEESVYLEIWRNDCDRIGPALEAAWERGVDVKVVGYNNVKLNKEVPVFGHGVPHDHIEHVGGRWIILAVDDKEGLIGTVSAVGQPPQALQTRNKGILFVIQELVIHDVFLLDLEGKLGKEMEAVYGKNSEALNEKILGRGTNKVVHHFSFCRDVEETPAAESKDVKRKKQLV
ncbi:MAG: TrmB family transcriptional regulator [Candidatus Melainabacteria bacterium]